MWREDDVRAPAGRAPVALRVVVVVVRPSEQGKATFCSKTAHRPPALSQASLAFLSHTPPVLSPSSYTSGRDLRVCL